MRQKIYFGLAILATAAILTGAFWWDFFIWRKVHPQAPGWTYIFHH